MLLKRDVIINRINLFFVVVLSIGFSCTSACAVEIAAKRYPIEIDGMETLFPYESSHDLSTKNISITRLIYSIHSASYSAKSYYSRAVAVVDKFPAQKNKTLIIAPHILDKSVLDNAEKKNILYWEIAAFRGTSRGFYKDKRVTVSAYDVTNMILEDVATGGNFPNLKTVIILGHSAGGQMTNRYAASGLFETATAKPKGIEVRYIVMAPSSYVYFNAERVLEGTRSKFAQPDIPAQKYNYWGHGLENLYSYHKRNNITSQFIIEQYPSKNILYLVGSKDCDEKDTSMGKGTASMLQGRHRLERAIIYFNYLNHFFGGQIKTKQHLRIVKDVGHSGARLMLSTPALRFIFSPNSPKSHNSQVLR